ncbi:hypothetical protein EON65_37055 [archaeon]|nr:MAG: hypothetical protein EON65_37055 [archaeon]
MARSLHVLQANLVPRTETIGTDGYRPIRARFAKKFVRRARFELIQHMLRLSSRLNASLEAVYITLIFIEAIVGLGQKRSSPRSLLNIVKQHHQRRSNGQRKLTVLIRDMRQPNNASSPSFTAMNRPMAIVQCLLACICST